MSSTRTATSRLIARTVHTGLVTLLLSFGFIVSSASQVAGAGLIVNVEPAGNGLQFHASSAFAVDWEIQVSLGHIEASPLPPHFRTGGTLPPRIHRSSSKGAAQRSFDPVISSLLPSTDYNYIVRGGSSYATGSIRTFGNRVTITFNKIDVIDDSDLLSAGDLTFHFSAGGLFERSFGEVQVPSGTAVMLPGGRRPIRYVLFDKIGTLKLAVEAVDDDIDAPFEACRAEQPPDGTSGSDNCFDRTTATFSTSLSEIVGPGQNTGTRTVTLQTDALRIQFKAGATITVDYDSGFIAGAGGGPF